MEACFDEKAGLVVRGGHRQGFRRAAGVLPGWGRTGVFSELQAYDLCALGVQMLHCNSTGT